ncbi:MAG: hypothetical protein OXC26_21825, partial [Albidovulum sp.]|nr:hypothetical protein [Albidovulum sp.]
NANGTPSLGQPAAIPLTANAFLSAKRSAQLETAAGRLYITRESAGTADDRMKIGSLRERLANAARHGCVVTLVGPA